MTGPKAETRTSRTWRARTAGSPRQRLATLSAMAFDPMLAVSSTRPPAGSDWVAEPKYDGFRTLITVARDGRCRVVSRHGRLWTDRFPELARIGRDIGRPVVLDGETVV